MVSPRRRRYWVVLGAAAVAAVLVIVALAVLLPRAGTGSACTPPSPRGFNQPQTFTLAGCDAVATLSPHSVTTYEVPRVSDTEAVEGQYTLNLSTYGSFDAYLVNMSEFGELMGNPHPTAPLAAGSFFYHCGTVPECNISVLIPGSPIAYYVALVNYGNLSVSTEWTQALTTYYVPH